MNKYGIKSNINHEAHEEHEEKAKSINALNLHALHVLHGYFFYIRILSQSLLLRDCESIIHLELKKLFTTENTKDTEKIAALIQCIKNFVLFVVIS